MNLSERLKSLLENFIHTFNQYEVDYLAVGGIAVNHHGFDPEKTILRLPLDYFKVELLPIIYQGMKSEESRKGFNQSYKVADENQIGKATFKVLGFDDLIKYKELSGRPKDLLDILELKNIKKIQGKG